LISTLGEVAMKKRLGSASACMSDILVPSGLPGVLATLGAPIMALVRKREPGRAILTNFAILAAVFAAGARKPLV
jgi:hypothetical protein